MQTLLSLQLTVVPTQLPALQVSPLVHALPSSHARVLFTKLQAPVVESQLSLVHGLPSKHSILMPP